MFDVEYILVFVLMVCGCAALAKIIMERVEASRRLAALTISMVLYLFFVIMFFVIALVLGTVKDALFALLVMATFIGAYSFIVFIAGNRDEINKLQLLLFVGYMLAILLVTLIGRNDTVRYSVNEDMMLSIREAYREGSMRSMGHFLMNVMMFIPLCVFFPLIAPDHLGRFFYTIPCGLMFSCFIESFQMILQRGSCDMEDILANTIGAVFGYLLFKLIDKGVF